MAGSATPPVATKQNPSAALDKAKEWARTAITQIGECKSERDIDDWYAEFAGHLAKLKVTSPGDGDAVSGALAEMRASLKPNVLAAG